VVTFVNSVSIDSKQSQASHRQDQ